MQYELREYAAAKQSHEQALAIRRKSLPPDHPDIATSLNNLGNVQYELREYAAAKQSHEQALAIRRKSLPAGPPGYRPSLNNLGSCSTRCGSMRRPSRAMSRRWPSAASPCLRTTPISPKV